RPGDHRQAVHGQDGGVPRRDHVRARHSAPPLPLPRLVLTDALLSSPLLGWACRARVGAAHGGGLWRRSGRSPSLLARLARGTSTTARASELQQAPAPAPAAVVPTHKVTVHDRERGVVHHFLVPQDQYILHTAEAQDITLPFACRHGCCTSCAVRIKSGQIRQPEALGISADLREQGYALLCVGYPSSDLEVETQDEDEVYWLQFGRYFARGPVVSIANFAYSRRAM
uniref:Ferredoxin n=2 Tax=Aegilops tauschii subsp. strangulata TaxID=200361 RepID=A0A453H332_AEGTS